MKRFAFTMLLMGSACASQTSTILPDGRSATIVDCSGNWASWDGCAQAARKSCGGDYEVVRQSEYTRDIKTMRELTFVCQIPAPSPKSLG